MSFLFPKRQTEISINEDTEYVLENINRHTEKYKPVRLIFSKHKLFEGDVLQNEFDLIFVGQVARPYRVKIEGKIENSNGVTLLKLTAGVTTFGSILSYVWLSGMIFFILFSLYIAISHAQIIVLTITLVGVLLMIIGILYAINGYKNETEKVLKLIEEIARGNYIS